MTDPYERIGTAVVFRVAAVNTGSITGIPYKQRRRLRKVRAFPIPGTVKAGQVVSYRMTPNGKVMLAPMRGRYRKERADRVAANRELTA